jgi:hypothetical protein
MQKYLPIKIGLFFFGCVMVSFSIRASDPLAADRSPAHPIGSPAILDSWLRRVPLTRDFPPDFADTLSGEAPAFLVETSSAPGCIPCADLWAKLGQFRARFGWRVAVIDHDAAMLRSGRLGLPWVGDPVVWVRPIGDDSRTIPVAVGTDRLPNLERNIYLATKMLTGVHPDVGVRAMAKFTGLVGNPVRGRGGSAAPGKPEDRR